MLYVTVAVCVPETEVLSPAIKESSSDISSLAPLFEIKTKLMSAR